MHKETLLIDFNNLATRHFFSPIIDAKSEYPNYNLWKFNIFNDIYLLKEKFKATQIIIAIDSQEPWRKLYYKRYKETRKEKQSTEVNWDKYHINFHNFSQQLKKYTPLTILKVARTEADDIIAILSKHIQTPKTIISTDKDFIQLINQHTKVYTPLKKEFQQYDEHFVIKQSLMGQAKDFILNVKTPLDHPIDKRKPPLGEKTANKIIEEGHMTWLIKNNLLERYNFNVNLIDFDKIPKTIEKLILTAYNEYELPQINQLYYLFEKNDWRYFLDNYDEVQRSFQYFYLN